MLTIQTVRPDKPDIYTILRYMFKQWGNIIFLLLELILMNSTYKIMHEIIIDKSSHLDLDH